VNIVQRKLRRTLKERGIRRGALAALGREIGVSGQFLGMVLSGRKRPGPKVLGYLGLEARETYHRPKVERAPGSVI